MRCNLTIFGGQVLGEDGFVVTQFLAAGDVIMLLGDFNANSASQMVKELQNWWEVSEL